MRVIRINDFRQYDHLHLFVICRRRKCHFANSHVIDPPLKDCRRECFLSETNLTSSQPIRKRSDRGRPAFRHRNLQHGICLPSGTGTFECFSAGTKQWRRLAYALYEAIRAQKSSSDRQEVESTELESVAGWRESILYAVDADALSRCSGEGTRNKMRQRE
jgi:hypothetical protein